MAKKIIKSLVKTIQEKQEFRRAKVFIVSFPKSGRTWLRVLIGKALCEKYGLDEQLIFDELKVTEAAGVLPTMYTHDGSSNTEGRHWRDLGAGKTPYQKKKILFLIRDPRDVAVSCFFQATKRKGLYKGTISDFIRDDCYGIRKIVTFFNIWHANQHVPEAFLPLRYEEMHADPAGNIRKALDFIGAGEVADEIIRRAVEYASFDNMRKLEEEGRFESKKLRPGKSRDEESFKVRKGKVGGFTDYLNAEDCAYVNGVMRELGCPFFPLESRK